MPHIDAPRRGLTPSLCGQKETSHLSDAATQFSRYSPGMITLEGLKFLGELVAKLMGLKKERKLEVAGYLKHISDTLAAFSPALSAGNTDQMEQLAFKTKQYADHIAQATRDVISPQELQSFVSDLHQAAKDKTLLAEGAQEDKQKLLAAISQACGKFAEAAERLEATASKAGH